MEAYYLCNSEIFGLSNSTAVVYNFLCKVNNVSSGKSFYGKESIAKLCNISKSTVIRAFRALCKKGLLEIRSRFDNGRQTSNEYILIENPQIKLKPDAGADTASKTARQESLLQPRLFPCDPTAAEAGLSPNEIKVYSYLFYRAGQNGKCMPSKKEIATDCWISVATVSRAIKALSRKDLIAVRPQTRMEKFGNNGTSVNQYTLLKVQKPDVAAVMPQKSSENHAMESADRTSNSTETNGELVIAAENALVALSEPKSGAVGFPSIDQPNLPRPQTPCQPAFIGQFCDTLPHISRDTPRTMPRMKATINSRIKRLFSQLAEWCMRIF